MAVLMTPPYMQFIDSSGNPLNGGKVFFYDVGTTDNKNTFTNQGGGTTNDNPVILDTDGTPLRGASATQIWLSGAYRIIVKTSADVVIKDVDNITAFSTGLTSGVSDITTDFTEAVVASADSFIFSDVGDNDTTKRDTMAGMADLYKGGLVLVSAQSASNDASIDFTSVSVSSTYEHYILEINDLIPATDGAVVHLRTSADGGTTFDSSASDYGWCSLSMLDSGTTVTGANDSADSEIDLTSATTSAGNGTGEAFNSTVKIYHPAGSLNTIIEYSSPFLNTGTVLTYAAGSGQRATSAAVNALQILMSTGNITSGEFRLYGVKKS